MRLSTSLFSTLREAPAEAEVPSHRLMLRAGLIQKVAAGVYVYAPMLWRTLVKVSAIVPKHDAGVGLRWLIPQLNSTVIRIDWAFATQSTTLTRAGFPGRASAGFQQIF